MGGDLIEDDWELASSSKPNRTLVLMGRTGNGKSTTGNSILGKKIFKSRASSLGVTMTSESHRAVQEDGRIITVIDTPGLFDLSTTTDYICKEIVRCLSLAEDGINAILLVFSVRSRLSEEEQTVLNQLQTLFGSKLAECVIVVFTGGDELEEAEETLEEYLTDACPKFLRDFLATCDNRLVLFDNKTEDKGKMVEQVEKLFSIVDAIDKKNKGIRFTEEVFDKIQGEVIRLRDQTKEAESLKDSSKNEISELTKEVESLKDNSKNEISELKKQIEISDDQQLSRISEIVVSLYQFALILRAIWGFLARPPRQF